MSKDFKNEFTWSVSREQLFRHCPRAYYYNYYGSWGGWNKDAPARTRQLYILKNIKTMILWSGSIVHDTIKEVLDEYARSQRMPTLPQLQEHARQKMRAGWVESTSKTWKKYPKKTNLFELFYGNGKSLPAEMTSKIKTRIFDALANFYQCAVVKEILATPYLQWKPVDVLDSFKVNEFKIWCAIDFAYIDSSQILNIIDWKTGQEHRETLRQQLGCYAIYAMEKWQLPIERISLNGVFLNDGGRKSNYPIEPELLIQSKIRF